MVMILVLLMKLTFTKINVARSQSKLEVQKTDDELAGMTERYQNNFGFERHLEVQSWMKALRNTK